MAATGRPAALGARLTGSPVAQTLAIRPLRFYLLATFFYFLAFGTQRFVFVWLVLELSDNAGQAGVVAFALGIPAFFITLPAGALADRLNRRSMVIWANLAGAFASVAIALVIWSDLITVGIAIGFALLIGITNATTQPPLTALIPTIVPARRLMNAIVLRTAGQNLAMVLGASVAGVAIDVWNIGGAFAVLSVATAISAVAMLGVPAARVAPTGPAGPRLRLWPAVAAGLGFIYHNRGLLGLVVLLGATGLIMLGPVFVLVPQIAREELGQSASGAALLFAITGVGMLAMSIVLVSITELRHKGAVLLVTMTLGGLAVIGLGASPWYAVTAATMFVWGLGGGIMINLNQTLAQSHTPDHMMGRVMSVVMLSIAGLMPLGSLAAGGAAELIGATATLMVCGSALVVIGGALWLSLPALREMD